MISGGFSEEATPVPIPNTEVKLPSADGTALATGWESRSPPDPFQSPSRREGLFFWSVTGRSLAAGPRWKIPPAAEQFAIGLSC
jgi:hypothetical protein